MLYFCHYILIVVYLMSEFLISLWRYPHVCFLLQCKYDFCWICLEEWKKHSSSTGGYYRCTRYEVIQHVEEQSKEMTVEVTPA